MVKLAKWGEEVLSGPLRLGVIPTIGPFLLPRILPQIRQQYPHLQLQITEDQSSRLVESLELGQLDVAILAFPYPIKRLEFQVAFQERFYIALPRGHDLEKQVSIEASLLPKEELLLLKEGHCLSDHALSACHLEGIRGSVGFQGTSLYTLVQMVAGGQGITFIPEMAIGDAVFNGDEIRLKPLDEPGPHREIGLVWRSTYFRKGDLIELASLISTLKDMA